jgi:hypothetical protein
MNRKCVSEFDENVTKNVTDSDNGLPANKELSGVELENVF